MIGLLAILSVYLTTSEGTSFEIVNRYGTAVKNSGLLLYKGGTVCDDGFDKNSAIAICDLMGYASTGSEWSSGSKWTIQYNFRIKLDNINCRSTSWSTCTYSESYYNDCYHSKDVFLTCDSSDQTGSFKLVDQMGRTADRTGLLLYKSGTVCNDEFDDNAANAICYLMGYAAIGSEWTSGSKWSIQSDYSIRLDDVNCWTNSWSICTYTESPNCYHNEDVFLTCTHEDQDICADHETLCHDEKQCINTAAVCDEYEDCYDGSDESNCKDQTSCADDETLCQDRTQCIYTSFVCDNFADCSDGSDESNCKGGLSAGGIVGIIIAVLAVIFGVFLYRKRKQNQSQSQQSRTEQPTENNVQTTVPAPVIPTASEHENTVHGRTDPDVIAMPALGIDNLAPPSYTDANSVSAYGEEEVPTYEDVMANEQIYDVAHIYDGQNYSDSLQAPLEFINAVGEEETCDDVLPNENLYNEY